MPDIRSEHPSSESLSAFAEGQLSDAVDILKHLDDCEACAQAVLISRQIACLVDHQLIAPLTREEQDTEKARLRQAFKAHPLKREVLETPGSQGPKSAPAKDASKWGFLGALAAGSLGTAHRFPAAKPMVAGFDQSGNSIGGHPPGNKEHGARPGDFENSENSSVMPEAKSASQRKTEETQTDGIERFLDHLHELLGTDASQAHDSSASQSDPDPGHHALDEFHSNSDDNAFHDAAHDLLTDDGHLESTDHHDPFAHDPHINEPDHDDGSADGHASHHD